MTFCILMMFSGTMTGNRHDCGESLSTHFAGKGALWLFFRNHQPGFRMGGKVTPGFFRIFLIRGFMKRQNLHRSVLSPLQPFLQHRVALTHSYIPYCIPECLLCSDQNQNLLRPGNAGIDQVPLQHHKVVHL